MINIKSKLALLFAVLVFAGSLSANNILPVVSGKISDIDNGESLPYAKISVKNTNRVATANQDGSFTILNIPVDSTLIINKLGYESKQIEIYQHNC